MTLASDLARGPAAGAAPHALARYRSEFPIFRDRVYLNTCSLGALGERARRKVAEFLDLWQSRGASAWYDVWWAGLTDLRARYARLVGAAPAEIALAPSISVAVSAVAESLDYVKRPRVVVTSLDFPTIAYQWLAKRARGVELVVVESPDQVSVPVEAIARAQARGFRPKMAADPAARSAIVMLPAPDPAAAVKHLADGGIIADARPGHVRFSPFFYNLQDDHVTALERLTAYSH